MKQDWEIKRLGDICDLQNGFAFKSNDYIDFSNTMNFRMSQIRPGGGIDLENNPKYLPDDYAVKYKDYLLKEGDVVIAMTDLATETKILGVPTIVPKDNRNWLLNQRVGKIFKIDYSKVNIIFLKYILTSETVNEYYKSLGRGGLQINIGKQDILNAKIPIPPLSEQQRIVSILDEAFAKIEKAKANAEQNLKNAKELFESYLQGVFENKGDDWEEKTLGEVLVKTETIDPTKKPQEKFIYLDVSSVNKETKEIENVSVLLGKDAPSRAKKLVRTNDVIFATVRPTHSRVALITEEYNEQVCSTGYFVLRAKGFLSNNLVYYFLLTYDFNKQMEKLQKGASYPAVTDSEVKGIYIPFPKSLKEQNKIVQKLDALSSETKKLEAIYEQKIKDLEELKKSVLQKAFSGEL